MDIDRLIECVRRHTFLYDLSHKDYKNVTLKATVWESIGRDINQTGDAAKKKWKSLRDGYTKYKKDLKATSSSRKFVTYIWSTQLSFLDNYNNGSNVELEATPTSPGTTPSQDSNCSRDCALPPSNPSTPPPAISQLWTTEFLEYAPSTSNGQDSPQNAHSTRPNKRKEVDDADNMIHVLNNKKNKAQDGIDYLFLSYADTFRRFPPREQALLKLDLAKLFTNTELRLLHNSEGPPTHHASYVSPVYCNVSSLDKKTSNISTIKEEPSNADMFD